MKRKQDSQQSRGQRLRKAGERCWRAFKAGLKDKGVQLCYAIGIAGITLAGLAYEITGSRVTGALMLIGPIPLLGWTFYLHYNKATRSFVKKGY